MYASDTVTVSIGLSKTVNHRAQKQNIIPLYIFGVIASIDAEGKVVQSGTLYFLGLLVIEEHRRRAFIILISHPMVCYFKYNRPLLYITHPPGSAFLAVLLSITNVKETTRDGIFKHFY